ncbi:MAG: thioredoxin [Chloroflexi bacterium]|nr:thioredoxin [Chloroflexota bacterium]
MGEVIHLTDANFDKEVAESPLPTLTDFWAAWCGPCKMIAPIIDQLAQEYDGKMKVTKLDVDQNPTVATRFGVMSIPTLILFKGGQPVERIVGYMPKEKLVERLKPHLG